MLVLSSDEMVPIEVVFAVSAQQEDMIFKCPEQI